LNRADFLRRLKDALLRIPADRHAEILADYESYFAEGAAAGRDEQEVADSLGNPARIAAELRLDHDLRTWRDGGGGKPTLRTFSALAMLALLDGAAWLPLLLGLFVVLLLFGTALAALVFGCATLFVSSFDAPLGGIAAVLLRALAYFSAGVALLAISHAAVYALASGFSRLRRIHRRVLRHSNEVSP
jgi:uncharacterized membrane protein